LPLSLIYLFVILHPYLYSLFLNKPNETLLMRYYPILSVILVILISSCSRPSYYQIANFEELTKSHQTIAVLPFEVYTYGKLPKDVTEEMLIKMEDLESTVLQAELHDGILESKFEDQGQFRVALQHYSETNLLLEKNGINVRESWTHSPEKLAETLGVDAVLLSRVEKEHYFSDGASAAIEIGEVLLSILSNDILVTGSAENKMLLGDYALVSHDGIILWQIGSDMILDWKYKTERCLSRMNSRSAKYFPY